MAEGVWILGIHMTKFGKHPDKDTVDLAAEAAMGALADGGVTMKEMGVLAAGNLMGGPGGIGQQLQKQIGQTGIPVYNVANACATGATALRTAIMTYAAEATGVAQAAQRAGLPVVISFTVETNGRLPSGEGLDEAIAAVDEATGAYPRYYMLNCAHPTHFATVLEPGAPWTARLGGLRANASRLSHAELDEATELDAGDPDELAREYAELRRQHPQVRVLGGCCGTNHVHVGAIARACANGHPADST